MATATLTIAASADDAYYSSSGDGSAVGSLIFAGYSFNRRGGVLRFTGGLPSNLAGATVTAASLALRAGGSNPGGASLTLCAIKAASPSMPTDYTSFQALSRTTATVAWTSPAASGGTTMTSPDLTTVVQELVTAYGASISAVEIILDPPGSDQGVDIEFTAWDSNSGIGSATLALTYTPVASPPPPFRPRVLTQAIRRASLW